MSNILFQSLLDESERRPMTVSELNAEVRAAVERGVGSVWVEGEIVDFKAWSSGHWYFNLNDGTAQIKCVCWKGTNARIRFKPKSGVTVRIRGRINFWEAKGELTLSVDSLEPSGEGALAAAYEQIKSKLEAEGLFAPELKRPIPFFPHRVAVITSQTGAAYHDIHSVLTRRSKTVSILLVPTLVQGEGAADSIRAAVENVNRYNLTLDAADRIDVMIVGRGGGSAEDLWAFNDEMLARSIRSSSIPVISAVGHEIDWTISDLVADLRAATPSAAAELVAGREEDILSGLRTVNATLNSKMQFRLLGAAASVRDSAARLRAGLLAIAQDRKSRFTAADSRLTPAVLKSKTTALSVSLESLNQKYLNAARRTLKQKDEALNVAMARLDTLSPLAVLTRGYSITQTVDGRILRDPSKVQPGDKLSIRVEHGKLNAEVLASE